MLRRLAIWGIRSYVKGPGKSWLYTTGLLMLIRFARSVLGRRPLIEETSIGRGQTIMIEHLPISHKRQIKEMKKDKKRARKARRRGTVGDLVSSGSSSD